MPPGNCCPILECSKYCAPSPCAIYCCIFLSYKNLIKETQITVLSLLGFVVNECFKAAATGIWNGATKLRNRSFFFHAFLPLKTYNSFFLLYRTGLCSQRNLLCSKYTELLTTKIHLHIVHGAVFLRCLSWCIFCRKAWDKTLFIISLRLTPSVQAKAFSALLSTLAEFDSKIGITKPETLLK